MNRKALIRLAFLPAFLSSACQSKYVPPKKITVQVPYSNEANRREFSFYEEIYNVLANASGGLLTPIDPSFPEEGDYPVPVPVEEIDSYYCTYDETAYYEGNTYSWYSWKIWGGGFTTVSFKEGSLAPSMNFAGKTVHMVLAACTPSFLQLDTTMFLILTDGESIFGFQAFNGSNFHVKEPWTPEKNCYLTAYGIPGTKAGWPLWTLHGPWRWNLLWWKDEIVSYGLGLYGTPKEGYESLGYPSEWMCLGRAELENDIISESGHSTVTYVTLDEPYVIEPTTSARGYGTRVEGSAS